jgi:hypothetical protein
MPDYKPLEQKPTLQTKGIKYIKIYKLKIT